MVIFIYKSLSISTKQPNTTVIRASLMQQRSSRPFEFKSKAKNRFAEQSAKYYRRKAVQEQQDKKKLRREVRLRRIHQNRAISVKYKGGKWWDKMMQIYFGEVNESDVACCAENTTSDIMLYFQQLQTPSLSYTQLFTYQHYPQMAGQQIVRILFHGIQDSSDSQSSSSQNQDIYQLVGFKYKLLSDYSDNDECYIVDPDANLLQPSKKLSVIKMQNLKKQHDLRAEFRIKAKLQYFDTVQDESTILQCLNYHQRFKKSHYDSNLRLWREVMTAYRQEKSLMQGLQHICNEATQLQTRLAIRNRLLFIKRGLNDKTEDELEQALQQLELEQQRLHFSRSVKKNSQLASYNDCKVCFNPEIREDNLILYCNCCMLSYHVHCYGLMEVYQPELYICDGCLYMEEHDLEYDDYEKRPVCSICYSRQEFPLKLLGEQYYHVTCLFAFNAVVPTDFNIVLKENAIQTINTLSKVTHQPRCQYCIPNHYYCGIRFKCQEPACDIYFHPICAYLRGCDFTIHRGEELAITAKCSAHTYSNEDDQIRQVYLRRFFCNFQNIQKLNEEQFKPLFREEKQLIELELWKVARKNFEWSQYVSPLRRKRREEFQQRKRKMSPNLSIQELMGFFTSKEVAKATSHKKQQSCSTFYWQQDETNAFNL